MRTWKSALRRWKYWLNGFVLLAPFWYFYEALYPQFPTEWKEQRLGPFTAAPMPLNDRPPYAHDGLYVKDFAVRFCEGCVPRIRSAYLGVASEPPQLPEGDEGVLHGSSVGQHVHAPFPRQPGSQDRLWLVVQEWNGQVHRAAWTLSTEVDGSSD